MTLRADVRKVLSTWEQVPGRSAQQRALAAEYLEFVAAHDEATWRSCRPGHITASALVLSVSDDPTRREVLLTLHPKVGRWLQLGGHCEPDDTTLAEAALREAREESGISGLRLLDPAPLCLDRHWVGCHGGAWHYDVQYVVVAPPGATATISHESLDLAWFSPAALPAPHDQSLLALVAAAVALPADPSVPGSALWVQNRVVESGSGGAPRPVAAACSTPARKARASSSRG